MRITRFAKAIVYECFTALLIVLSFVFQNGLQNPEQMEIAYSRSNWFLFITAAVLLGVGVYSLMSYTSRHREHILDSVFFIVIGVFYMVAAMIVFLTYGGLEGTFTQSGYTAANINLVLLSALPAPFLVRTIVLVFSTREKSVARRTVVQIVCGLLAAALVALILTGRYMHMLTYVEPAESQGIDADDTDPYADAYDFT